MNPWVWGVIDYRAKLSAHKLSIKSSIRKDPTPYTKSRICYAQFDAVEEPAASMAVSSIPASITTKIAPICSRPPPATPKYHGDLSLTRNVPAKIKSSQNVRLWITGLPSSITTTELLGAIRGVGSIFATNIVGPQPPETVDDDRQRVRTVSNFRYHFLPFLVI